MLPAGTVRLGTRVQAIERQDLILLQGIVFYVAVMVVIMTVVLGVFFFGLDTAFSAIVQQLLKLVA